MSRAGNWTSPPPPTTASTQPATSAATASSATVAGPACPGRSNQVNRRTGSRPVRPGVDDGQEVEEALDDGVGPDIDRHLLLAGDV